MKQTIVLKIKNLSLKKSNQNILTEVSFNLPKSCLASIIGPTGAGKTSIIRSIMNFENNNNNDIQINNKLATEMNLREIAKQVAYVHQNSLFPSALKVYDIMGRLVKTLVNDYKVSGNQSGYSIVWDGRDNKGQQVATGLYIYS